MTDQEDQKHTAILPITEDALCPFLKENLECAIYEDRPEICKKFGDESHWTLKCPMQHKDGTPRSDEEKIELTSKIDEWLQENKIC
jgi:Fe-S-cluster containining protein